MKRPPNRNLNISIQGVAYSKEYNSRPVPSYSPRVKGKLKIRANRGSRTSRRVSCNPYTGTDGKLVSSLSTYEKKFMPAPQNVLSNADVDRCTTDFYNKLSEVSVNLLDLYRTRHETSNMITSNVNRLSRSIRLLKKGKWKKAASALGVRSRGAPKSMEVPQRWLELQYGWKPLIQDIYNIGNKAFHDPKIKVYKSVKAEKPWLATDKDGSSVSGVIYDRFAVSSLVQLKSDVLPTMQNLGVLNPSLVAWEAVPYSFIVDWFYPVGDWLSALTASSGLVLSEGVRCRSYRIITSGYIVWMTGSGSKRKVLAQTYGESDYYSYTRVLGVGSVPTPSFQSPLSLNHFANAMSLLATGFGRKGLRSIA